MRSLSVFNLTAIDNPYVDSIFLIEIELSGLTLYLCDRVFGNGINECVFNGQRYEPIITSIGSLSHGAIDPVSYKGKPGKFSFVVDNTVTIGPAVCFSKLFLLYSFYFVPVSAFQIYEGASAGDKITRFKGLIENHSDMTQATIEITCAGPELTLSDSFVHEIIDATAYPGADPDDLGKMLPQAYGTVKRVPLISIDAGSITTLVTDINASYTTIVLTDSSKFPASGTIQIDLEQITYTGNANNQLTGCSRGQNGTTAVEHTAGAKIGEVQSYYWYIMGHAVKTMNNVYVDGIRQLGNHNAYTGQAGDNDPSGLYNGKACVRFNVLPIIKKQVNLDDHLHDPISYPINKWELDSVVLISGFATNFEALVDNNFISGAFFYGGSAVSVNKILTEGFGGLGPRRARMGMVIHSNPNGHTIRYYFPYLGELYRSAPGTYRDTWRTLSLTWDQFLALSGLVRNYSTPDGTNAEVSIFIEIEFDGSAASAAITGNTVAETVIGGLIAADVDGFQDDGSGTYTGTPNALIERPDHIMKHALIDRCGKAAGDIDSTSYTASGVSYNAEGFKLGVVLLTKPDIRKLIFDIATQSKSIEFWESGTHHLIYIPATESVDKILDSRIDLDSISIRLANRVNIKNKMSATYDKHWSGKGDEIIFYSFRTLGGVKQRFETARVETEQAVVKATSADSITKYGTLEADRLSFQYITTEAQAQDVIDWMQDNQKDIILLLEFIGGHHLMEIEKGDVVQFTFVADDQLDRAFLGMISTVGIFRVLDMSYENENARLSLETGSVGLTASLSLIGFNPLGGTYHSNQSVILISAVVDADIYYTTDGSDPDTGSTLYSNPISVTQGITIKARLYVNGVISGSIQTAIYALMPETPVISPPGGEYESSQEVTIMCVTEGVVIRYTTDGTEPGENSDEYTAPFTVSSTTTIKAKAFKTDWTPSRTAGASFVIAISNIWVTNYNDKTISKIDSSTNEILATIDVADYPVAVTSDGTHIWVAIPNDDDVVKININTNTIVATVDVGDQPHFIAFDGAHIWVVNYASGTVSKINISTNSVVATVTGVGSYGPRGITFGSTHIWITNSSADTASKININTNSVVATVNVGNTPRGIAFDGAHIWVVNTDDDTVSKINISTNSVVATVGVGNAPVGVAFDGVHIWVVNSTGWNLIGTVSKINVNTNSVVATIEVGRNPRDIAFNSAHVWVTNPYDDTISKINISTNAVVATIDVGDKPFGICAG